VAVGLLLCRVAISISCLLGGGKLADGRLADNLRPPKPFLARTEPSATNKSYSIILIDTLFYDFVI